MKTQLRALSGSAAAAATLAVAAPATHAAPTIIGGQQASNPAIVQLAFSQDGGVYGCTGEAISAEWVLTARHCTEGDEWMDVYHSNDTQDPGEPVAADAVYDSPNGDVGLVHLSEPVPLSSYPTLTSSFTPSAGTAGTIWGYGLRANQASADHLYSASVSTLGSSTDAYGGPAIHIKGTTGAANHGDSGGPLFIGGVIVGVCSTGDEADPGANTQASSNYANLTASRSWIRSISGV